MDRRCLYQNGEAINPSNGYPMQLLLPGYEGNMNVKWLRRIKLVESPVGAIIASSIALASGMLLFMVGRSAPSATNQLATLLDEVGVDPKAQLMPPSPKRSRSGCDPLAANLCTLRVEPAFQFGNR